ncbi:MAG: restriction endonuclease subunit S [Magnetococcales bacterium]|nr:restriction endonuclease subunit S [Magnetococcales bacterium]
MRWLISQMEELCDITSSKRIFAKDYVPEGVPFYRGKEIVERFNGAGNPTTPLFITRNRFEDIAGKFGVPQPGDILLTSVGTLGFPFLVVDEEFYFKDGNLTWFRNMKAIDSKFLFYWLISPSGKAQLRKCTIGTSQSAYTIERLKKMEVSLPPKETQRRISSILSTYDDLIENNRRRIRLLEEAARLLYREWFVHFRFPGHEHVKIIDGVPEGWERKRIGDFCTKIGSGATPRGGAASYQSKGITLIRSLNIYDYEFKDDGVVYIDEKQAKKLSNVTVETGDVLINITGASVARCCIVPNRHLPARVNQHVMIMRPVQEIVCPEYLMCAINSGGQKKFILNIARAGGATREALTKDTIAGLELIVPKRNLMKVFHSFAHVNFSQIETLEKQNHKLRAARDLLLPRLMNGEIAV